MSWTDLAERKAALSSISEYKINPETNTIYGLDSKGNTISACYDMDKNGVSEFSIFNYGKNKTIYSIYDNDTGRLSNIAKYTDDKLTNAIEYYYDEEGNCTSKDVTDNYK